MCQQNSSALLFTCSLIEYIGRQTKNMRTDVVRQMGREQIERLYDYSDVFHSEPIQKVADEFIHECQITDGSFDNINSSAFQVPSFWDIGKVYERLIEDVSNKDNIIDTLMEVFASFIDEYISDFNLAVYYQSREYIATCYKTGMLL